MTQRISACARYVPTPVHQLQENQMCVPDLYTFIKLYGTDKQVSDMTALREFKREYMVPIYRKVRKNPQRIRQFFGRTDLPPLPIPDTNQPNVSVAVRRSSRLSRVSKQPVTATTTNKKSVSREKPLPLQTTSCSVYTHSRYDALDEKDMCQPDLYAYIKVFGNNLQREALVNLRSKTRRAHLLPLYREVVKNGTSKHFIDTRNMRQYLNKGLHNNQTFRNKLTNNNERRWYNQLTYVFTLDDAKSVIDALEQGDMSLAEIYDAREEMTRTQRLLFDQMIVDLLRYKRFQRKDTMELFVKLGNPKVNRLFTATEKKWYQEIKADNR